MERQKIISVKRNSHVLQTIFLLLVMVALLLGSGWLIAGQDGVVVAAVIPILALIFVPKVSSSTIMRFRGAQLIDPWREGELYRLVEPLARKAGLTQMPRLYWERSKVINAYTVGDGLDTAIALSDGALHNLTQREMKGVLAHEISHLAAGDGKLALYSEVIRFGTSVVSTFGVVLCLYLFLIGLGDHIPYWIPFVFLFTPHFSTLIQLAVSRSREFAADKNGVMLTGDTMGLVSALSKIKSMEHGFWFQLLGATLPSTKTSWLKTHPALEKRIIRLTANEKIKAMPSNVPVSDYPRPSHLRLVIRRL